MNGYQYNVAYVAGTPNNGTILDFYTAPGSDHRGELKAWDPIKQTQVWAVDENFPVWSGTVAMAGDLVFYGTVDRWFKAADARTGKMLWQFHAPSGIMGQPITYAVNGVQYVAVLSGVGGAIGGVAVGDINPRVRNAAGGEFKQTTTPWSYLQPYSMSRKPTDHPAAAGFPQFGQQERRSIKLRAAAIAGGAKRARFRQLLSLTREPLKLRALSGHIYGPQGR